MKNPVIFGSSNVGLLVKLFQFIFKVNEDNRPFATDICCGDNRLVSMWAYPGVGKTPIDRIDELMKENEYLRCQLTKTGKKSTATNKQSSQ